MFRPWHRVSIRTLFLLLTAIGGAFGCREATVTWGAKDIARLVCQEKEVEIVPEVLPDGQWRYPGLGIDATGKGVFVVQVKVSLGHRGETRYYFWLFGLTKHLAKYDRTWFLPDSSFYIVPAGKAPFVWDGK